MPKKFGVVCLLSTSLILGACAQEEEVPIGDTGHVKGFFGAVAVDEPNAALIGRQVLTAGGTAADAAVAIGFTMAATYPGRAGLGAGGVCVVHDGTIGLTESLDFRGPAGTLKSGDRPAAVPAMARGLAVLHSRYGALDWRQLVLPAERLARYGYRISRAAVTDMKLAEKPLLADKNFSALFSSNGKLIDEGNEIEQLDLAVALSKIRVNGAGTFYQGPFARKVAQSIQAAGGNVSEKDLREFIPQWGGLLSVNLGERTAFFPEPPAGGASVMAQTLAMAAGNELYADSEAIEQVHLFVEATKQAYKNQSSYLVNDWKSNLSNEELTDIEKLNAQMSNYDVQKSAKIDDYTAKFIENAFSSGFVVVDRSGNAVACDIGLNNLFGIGRIAPDLGFTIAASPNSKSRNPMSLAPMIVTATTTGKFYSAAAGAGTSDKKIAAIESYLDLSIGKTILKDSVAKPRYGVSPDLKSVFVEAKNSEELVTQLRSSGHDVKLVDESMSRLNMVYCNLGLPRTRTGNNCSVATDPRGHGLSLMAVDTF